MPIENSWGKSAVDATRKNALPPYLDALADYMGLQIYNVTLSTGTTNWKAVTGESDKFYQTASLPNLRANDFIITQADVNNINEKISWGFIVKAIAGDNQVTFYALGARPTEQLTVYVAVLNVGDTRLGGGVTSYSELTNKPTIDGVVLQGNMNSNIFTNVNARTLKDYYNGTQQASADITFTTTSLTHADVVRFRAPITITGDTVNADILHFVIPTAVNGVWSAKQIAMGEYEEQMSMWIRDYTGTWSSWIAVGSGGAGAVDVDLDGASTIDVTF